MPIQTTVYDTSTLLGVMVDPQAMQPPSSYWLDLCFPTEVQFDDEFIDFSRLSETRKLAPLVVPTSQGVPIYAPAESMTRVKPAYVKPKDPVSATRVIRRVAGLGELGGRAPMSPSERYNAIVTDILKQHRHAIERRWEWLAAEAVQHGQVTLVGENYPERIVNFNRAAAHTVTLTGATRWGQSGVDILGNLETWKKMTRLAKHGGASNRVTIGAEAWEVMRKDADIKEWLKTDYTPNTRNGLDLNLGVMEGLEVEHVGKINGTTDVYVYSDYYEEADGTTTPFMDPRDVVLTGPNVSGIRAFAAIEDVAASWQPMQMFPKMWNVEDPSATFVMTQSAPLMVPLNPNATMRARVL